MAGTRQRLARLPRMLLRPDSLQILTHSLDTKAPTALRITPLPIRLLERYRRQVINQNTRRPVILMTRLACCLVRLMNGLIAANFSLIILQNKIFPSPALSTFAIDRRSVLAGSEATA